MLKFVPNRCKTQELCENTVKKVFYAISYVPDTFKFHEIGNIIVLNLIKFKDSRDV